MLKGCLRSIQAMPAESAAKKLELDAMDGNWLALPDDFSAAKTMYEQTAEAVRRYLSG